MSFTMSLYEPLLSCFKGKGKFYTLSKCHVANIVYNVKMSYIKAVGCFVISFFFTITFAQALDMSLLERAVGDRFTNKTGIKECVYIEHLPGQSAQPKKTLAYFGVSIPSSFKYKAVNCSEEEVMLNRKTKNLIPELYLYVEGNRGNPTIKEILEKSKCETKKDKLTVYGAFDCRTLGGITGSPEQEYDVVKKEIDDLNCWANPNSWTDYTVKTTPEACKSLAERYQLAEERRKDLLKGVRFSCSTTDKTPDQIKSDKKFGCQMIQNTCMAYDKGVYEKYCAQLDTPTQP
ncbi:MAG: hypothetical protein RI911_84, partial [Candidatus Parcubacteria bacterium]